MDKESKLSFLAQRIVPSQTLLMNRKAKDLKLAGKKIFNLAAGEPYWDTPEPVKEAARKAMAEGITKYGPTEGFLSLREEVAAYAEKELSLSYSPDQVLVSSGAKQSLYLALQALLDPGDKVVLPRPAWVSYGEMIRCCGGEPLFVTASFQEKFVLDPDFFPKEAREAKVLILNNPCNPTGRMLSSRQLEKIAAFVEKTGCFVLADEIYEAFSLTEEPFVSFAQVADKEILSRTVTVLGVSKTFSMTGWRIGFALGPEPVIKAMGRLQDHQTSCANTIAQKAAEEALRLGKKLIEPHLAILREVVAEACACLKASSLPCYFLPPQGAFYLFPDFSAFLGKNYQDKKIETMGDFALALLEEEGVATVPGEAFWEKRGLRLSLAREPEEVREGMKRLCSFGQKLLAQGEGL